MLDTKQNSNATEATPAVANQAPIIQMSAADLEIAVKSLVAQMASGPASAPSTPQGGPVVVQVSADQLRQAVHDTIVEMQQNAAASSKTAILSLITLPFRAASDWAHWLVHGDCDPDAFDKPAGSKVWPTAKS